jgi:hypothetical protein
MTHTYARTQPGQLLYARIGATVYEDEPLIIQEPGVNPIIMTLGRISKACDCILALVVSSKTMYSCVLLSPATGTVLGWIDNSWLCGLLDA